MKIIRNKIVLGITLITGISVMLGAMAIKLNTNVTVRGLYDVIGVPQLGEYHVSLAVPVLVPTEEFIVISRFGSDTGVDIGYVYSILYLVQGGEHEWMNIQFDSGTNVAVIYSNYVEYLDFSGNRFIELEVSEIIEIG